MKPRSFPDARLARVRGSLAFAKKEEADHGCPPIADDEAKARELVNEWRVDTSGYKYNIATDYEGVDLMKRIASALTESRQQAIEIVTRERDEWFIVGL